MSSLARLRGGSWSEYYSQIHIVAVREGCQETMATNQGRFSRLVAENESRTERSSYFRLPTRVLIFDTYPPILLWPRTIRMLR